jgi:hypothetical protein
MNWNNNTRQKGTETIHPLFPTLFFLSLRGFFFSAGNISSFTPYTPYFIPKGNKPPNTFIVLLTTYLGKPEL